MRPFTKKALNACTNPGKKGLTGFGWLWIDFAEITVNK